MLWKWNKVEGRLVSTLDPSTFPQTFRRVYPHVLHPLVSQIITAPLSVSLVPVPHASFLHCTGRFVPSRAIHTPGTFIITLLSRLSVPIECSNPLFLTYYVFFFLLFVYFFENYIFSSSVPLFCLLSVFDSLNFYFLFVSFFFYFFLELIFFFIASFIIFIFPDY